MINYRYSGTRPKQIVDAPPLRYLRFDIEEVEEGETKQFRYLEISQSVFKWDFAHLVAAIVRCKYSADDVEAIVLNQGDGNEEHEREWHELQEWRKRAKEVMRGVLTGE